MTARLLAVLVLTAGCAVGPGYHRPALGVPPAYRNSSAAEDSLRAFYDSLRPSRDALLPRGAATARVPFAYDATSRTRSADSGVTLRWPDLLQDSVLRRLVDTSLKENRDVRTAIAGIDEFRAQRRAAGVDFLPHLTANGQAGRNEQVFGTFGSFMFGVYRAS